MNYIELKNTKDKLFWEMVALNKERFNNNLSKEKTIQLANTMKRKKFEYNVIVAKMKEM